MKYLFGNSTPARMPSSFINNLALFIEFEGIAASVEWSPSPISSAKGRLNELMKKFGSNVVGPHRAKIERGFLQSANQEEFIIYSFAKEIS